MRRGRLLIIGIVMALFTVVMAPAASAGSGKGGPPPEVRFATFNASLNRFNEGDLAAELSVPGSAQPDVIAEIIQRVRPDVLLINEFDYDAGNVALDGFQDNYLSVAHGYGGADRLPVPLHGAVQHRDPVGLRPRQQRDVDCRRPRFPIRLVRLRVLPRSVRHGRLLDVSRSISTSIRTFQNFLWKDMPGALLPTTRRRHAAGTRPDELDVFRLSSKSHWDVPIEIDNRTVHFLVSHPTPPVFDGPEDRNGTRNHDEIRFWADYVHPGRSGYIYDDDGVSGGLRGSDRFVIAGDQNSDPLDGDSIPGAIQQLLDHPKVNTKVTPSSPGGRRAGGSRVAPTRTHLSDPAFDTADFSDFAPGNLRADYVLPRKNMKITDAGVFWPLSTDPLFALVGTFPFPSSDHRLVWIDVRVN